MKLNELIEALTAIRNENGNLEVAITTDGYATYSLDEVGLSTLYGDKRYGSSYSEEPWGDNVLKKLVAVLS